MWSKLATLVGGNATIVAAVAAFAVGFWAADLRGDAGHAADYKRIARDAGHADMAQAKALVTLVANAGGREMNYLWSAQADRAQCIDTVGILQAMHTQSAEAQKLALARADRLRADLNAKQADYDKLVKSYEDADERTRRWLDTDLPDGIKCVRYNDPGCSADPFAAAGYPAPPDHPAAMEKPAGPGGAPN